MSAQARVVPVGDAAVSVELGDTLDAATNARVRALDHDLAHAPFEGLREAVPTHRSLLVLYDPAALRFRDLEPLLLARAAASAAAPPAGVRHEVPTVYGGEHGQDLARLARELSLPEAELVRLHCSTDYVAFMLGFTPGFPYLGLVPEALRCSRHATPRLRVPAGSVALADRLTGIYPVASPGGWQLIGRTSLRLFDPYADRPARIAAGDSVRFVPVAELPPPAPTRPAPRAEGTPAVRVVDPGLLTSVQDGGRPGWRRFGVAAAGMLVPRAHGLANQAVGNPPEAAALECTLSGPTLAFTANVHFAIAGADLGAVLERSDLGPWPVPVGAAVLARAGNVLRFTGRQAGCRAVLAFAGGIEVPRVLGSSATDLQSGFGGFEGRALAAGDRLLLGKPAGEPARASAGSQPPAERVTVRVVLGPQRDALAEESLERFLSSSWRLSAASDRVGCRLSGEPLRHRGSAEILSDGMVPGSIQVPPDGQPILMLADAPTTGGYPKIATVLGKDLPLVAQLVPGAGELRFEAVPIEELRRDEAR